MMSKLGFFVQLQRFFYNRRDASAVAVTSAVAVSGMTTTVHGLLFFQRSLPHFLLEHYVKQQLFQSLPLHTGPSLNCPGETAELWQSELSWPLVRT